MRGRAIGILLLAITVGGAGCGATAVDVAGTYDGTCSGTLSVFSIPIHFTGSPVSFTLQAAGEVHTASGTLTIKRPNGSVGYQASIGGRVEHDRAALTFTSFDLRSSGTMTADFDAGCWPNGTWTITSAGSSGSGSWSACRRDSK